MSDSSTDLVPVGSFELAVPRRTAKLLYVSDRDPSSISTGLGITIRLSVTQDGIGVDSIPPDDPSTIYLKLPIQKPHAPETIPRPSYYPSYAALTPEQRWLYLDWLRNVASPINIGYVFIYFYGLERQLLLGDFNLAFEEILLLQNHHENPSFSGYSNTALLYASLMRKRKDKLEQLYQIKPRTSLKNFDLHLAHYMGFDLSARNLIELANSITGISRTVLRAKPELFESVLTECLRSRYGVEFFSFASRYQVDSLPKRQEIIFANYSFPPRVRTPELPDFLSYEPFIGEVRSLFNETNTRIKSVPKPPRKKTRK